MKHSQLWVVLVEKGYAKLNGSYKALTAGGMSEAIEELTGKASSQVSLRGNPKLTSPEEVDLVWAKLSSFYEAAFLFGASTGSSRSTSPDSLTNLGLLPNHLYSLLQVKTTSCGKRVVQLRNPWGRSNWKGELCQGSSQWTESVAKELEYRGGNEEEFWLTFQELLEHFAEITICHIPRDASQEEEVRASGRTLNHPSRFGASEFVYSLQVFSPTWITITLVQPNQRKNHSSDPSSSLLFGDLGFILVPTNDDDVDNNKRRKGDEYSMRLRRNEKIHFRGSEFKRVVTEQNLFLDKAGKYNLYVLSIFSRLTSTDFVVAIHHDKPILLDRHLTPFNQFLISLAQSIRSRTPSHTLSYSLRSHVLQTASCVYFYVENIGSRPKRVALDCSGSINYCSSRELMILAENLPPNHGMIVQVLSVVDPAASSIMSYRMWDDRAHLTKFGFQETSLIVDGFHSPFHLSFIQP
eukprot:TRINITY_DN9915_c0_g1_i1.p1 TRINITY_DN9915_c0_g1~~TRINITY_DN9915_c0_g1_i1.p1  ORF type:complete len:466 (-),score=101.06 TRINITY_DN9915_c0_g1_i1:166-1563(-)